MADSALEAGNEVVVDAVNPVEEARAGWRELAAKRGAPLKVIEVVCEDPVEHRRRVQQRQSDLAGFAVPTWDEVLDRDYRPWSEPRLTVDTALDQRTVFDEIRRYLADG